jgi:hypothetical protein
MSQQQWTSSGSSADLSGPAPQWVARISNTEQGVKITGCFGLECNPVILNEFEEAGGLPTSVAVFAKLSLMDGGKGDDLAYCERIISTSATIAGQVRCRDDDGTLLPPQVLSVTASGTGVVRDGIISMRWPDILPANLAIVHPGTQVCFDIILGKFNPNSRRPRPNQLRCSVLSHSIGRLIPHVSNFQVYDSSKNVGTYSDANLRITSFQLRELQARLTAPLTIENLYIESANQDGDDGTASDLYGACDELFFGSNIFVQSSTIIDLSQIVYDATLNSSVTGPLILTVTNPDATSGSLNMANGNVWKGTAVGAPDGVNEGGDAIVGQILPSITIEGATLGGDIIFMGKAKMPRTASFLRITAAGCLMGRPKTLSGPIVFGEFVCKDASYVSDQSELHVYAAFSAGPNFETISYPFRASTVEIENSCVLARLVTDAAFLVSKESVLGDVEVSVYASTIRALTLGICSTKAGRISVVMTDFSNSAITSTKNGSYTVEDCSFEKLRIVAVSKETFMVSTCSLRELDISQSRGLELFIMSSENGRSSIGRFQLDNFNQVTVQGRLDIATIIDDRTNPPSTADDSEEGLQLRGFRSQINITSMALNVNAGFPSAKELLLDSKIHIGSLNLSGSTAEDPDDLVTSATTASGDAKAAVENDDDGGLATLLTAVSEAEADINTGAETPEIIEKLDVLRLALVTLKNAAALVTGITGPSMAAINMAISAVSSALGAYAPRVLRLDCGGVAIREAMDRYGACSGLFIVGGSIDNFIRLGEGSFTLVAMDSSVKATFKTSGPDDAFFLKHVVSSKIDVSGRVVRNEAPTDDDPFDIVTLTSGTFGALPAGFDNGTKLKIPAASVIDYTAGAFVPLGASRSLSRFQDLEIGYPIPKGASDADTKVVLPVQPGLLMDLIRCASAWNTTNLPVKIGVNLGSEGSTESFSIRPKIMQSWAGVAVSGGIPRLSYDSVMRPTAAAV